MLASPASEWPQGGGWVLEPKYDGYRLLVETRADGRVCAWSRHGTSLTEQLRELLEPFSALDAGWVFDGELIALTNRDGRPAQDFAAVGRAVFGGATGARHSSTTSPLTSSRPAPTTTSEASPGANATRSSPTGSPPAAGYAWSPRCPLPPRLTHG